MKPKSHVKIYHELSIQLDRCKYSVECHPLVFFIQIYPLITDKRDLNKLINSKMINQYSFYFKNKPIITYMKSIHIVELEILPLEEQVKKIRKEKLKSIL